MALALAEVQCSNSPVVALLNFTTASGTSTPLSAPVFSGTHVAWMRLLPVGMPADDIATVLHRSHHAMALLHAGRASGDSARAGLQGREVGRHAMLGAAARTSAPQQPLGQLYLLWGGYGSTMTVLDDLWVVRVFAAAECSALQSGVAHGAWCWTAHRVQQHGAPPGRAYAKLVPLSVRRTASAPCVQ